MRALLVVVVAGACSRAKDRQQQQPIAQTITAATGPVTLLAADGRPMNPYTIADYRKAFADVHAAVVAHAFPDHLSPRAGASVNMSAGDKNVSWVIDGTPEQGFTFIYDANANGDLRDDPVRPLAKVGGAWELTLKMNDAPVRIRWRDGKLWIQEAIERRGSLALPRGPMQFVLVGDDGRFGDDYQFIALDLDRDGHVDADTLDNPELFHVFEKTVTLDDTSYAFEVAPDGGKLTLRPLPTRLPPRPPLTTGTPAPDLHVTDLDGKPASLSALRGKVVLLDFWSTSCHPCIENLPRIAELHAKYAPRGFEVFGVADASDGVREALGEHRVGIAAQDEAAQAAYRIDRFPMYFLVGRDGTILCSRCRLDKIEPMLDAALR